MSELFLLTASALCVAGAWMPANSSLGRACVVLQTPGSGFSIFKSLIQMTRPPLSSPTFPSAPLQVLPFQPFLPDSMSLERHPVHLLSPLPRELRKCSCPHSSPLLTGPCGLLLPTPFRPCAPSARGPASGCPKAALGGCPSGGPSAGGSAFPWCPTREEGQSPSCRHCPVCEWIARGPSLSSLTLQTNPPQPRLQPSIQAGSHTGQFPFSLSSEGGWHLSEVGASHLSPQPWLGSC